MSVRVLIAAPEDVVAQYRAPLGDALNALGIIAELVSSAAPETVDYIVYAPSGGLSDFTPFTRARAVLSLWAGVERIAPNPTLTQPLARMVDPGLTQGMVEYVTGHVLRHHLGMDRHILARPGEWIAVEPPLAGDRKVAILGLGELGQACARALSRLGFDVHGWSRRGQDLEGVTCRSGQGGLAQTLGLAQIVVTLLPLTPATENLLDAARLALLPQGAVIINPGRGGLIEDAALLAALDAGQLAQATLDVFRVEPLPRDHPFWHHPKVTVTPHVAATTRARSAARVIAQNIHRDQTGATMLHLVDRTQGY